MNHTIILHSRSHAEAEWLVVELQKQGFDMEKLSIIGKNYQTAEHIRGFLTWQDTAKVGVVSGGYWGSFVGGLFGILVGAGVIFLPGIGPIIIAGPITSVLAGWLEDTIIGGVGSAAVGGLAGALIGLGIPQNEVLRYETQIHAGKFIILVTGSDQDVTQAQRMMREINAPVAV